MTIDIEEIIKTQYDGDHHKALKELEPLADQGNAEAMFNIGRIFREYSAVDIPHMVFYWYKRAADHGHAEAQHNLGVMYSKGRGVKKDVKEAVKCWRKAADQGFA